MAIESGTFTNMAKIAALLFILSTLVACDNQQDATTDQPKPRWMDRTIYLAKPDDLDSNRNNAFQKERVKEAFRDLESQTLLGEGYFSFSEIEEGGLDTSVQAGIAQDQKSFVLIWPDKVFDDYVVNTINGATPDPNGIAVINASDKRKFFIILRASCVTYSQGGSCPNIGVDGFKALVFRQFGLLLGMSKKDCASNPTDVMCADVPSALQYSTSARVRAANAFNNLLESILLNPAYYPQ